MKRFVLLLGLFAPATASAVGIVPPIIRLNTTDTSDSSVGSEEDPLKTIERITKNARTVGDRLQNEDAGSSTQMMQEQLLKDIDSLLKPPPPMNNSGGGGSPPPPKGGDDSSKNPPPPMGGESPPPMGSGGGGGQSPPMGGSSKRPRGERNEEQSGGQGKQQPMGGNNQQQKKEPKGGGGPDPKTQPMSGADSGKDGQSGSGDGGKKNTPDLPLDDPFTRRVWGHLPEKVRQQAMQSYREQFMPRYTEMLKQYYSTLNEKQSPK